MVDMDGLSRAVEEARLTVVGVLPDSFIFEDAVDALIAAVSAKARAEERERHIHVWEHGWANYPNCSLCARRAIRDEERARSSEEAGNG